MGRPNRWILVLVLSFVWLLVGTDCNGRPLRETQIVSFEINPNPVVRGGDVVVAWQAEHVGWKDRGPYCTLQRTFEGQPAEDLVVVDCVGSRTDAVDAAETVTYVNYRFSALRRTGQAYETDDIRLEILHAGVAVAPASVTLEPLSSHDFTATVTGVADTSVTWDASCGSISGSGSTVTYTAPASVPDPPTCQVTATSHADPNASASAVVTVAHGAGAVIWTRQFGTGSGDSAAGVAVDGSGNVVVAGWTLGSLDGVIAGNSDAFVRKFDAAGTVVWARQFGTSGYEVATGLVVDGSANVVVAGYTSGSLEGVSAGMYDAFVRSFDEAGNVIWTRQFGTSMSEFATSVAVDDSGSVVVVGWTYGSLEGVSAGGIDAFARKFDAAGSVVWTRQFGTSSHDYAQGVAVDDSANVVVVGMTGGSLEGVSAGGVDAFVRKFDAAGNVLWTRQFGASSNDRALGVAVDGSGNVVVVGETVGSLEGVSAGGVDAFVRKFDAAGNVVWTRQFGTSSDEHAWGVAVDGSGNAVVVGETGGSLEGVSAGGRDAFVRKYAP